MRQKLGENVLQTLRGLGVALRLADDGEGIIVTGLKQLSPEKAALARQLCRSNKAALRIVLAADAAQSAKREHVCESAGSCRMRDFYQLRMRYTHPKQIESVLSAWDLRLEVENDDFCIVGKPCLALLPDLIVFFRSNGAIINQYLREKQKNCGESHARSRSISEKSAPNR